MRQALIHGDVHGRDTWKKLIKEHNNPNMHHIFVGDYVDSFNISDSEILSNFQDILEFKKSDMDRVHLLMGNHDMQYYFLNDKRFMCSGFRSQQAIVLNDLFTTNKGYFDLGIQLDNTFITHAGICQSWLDEFKFILEDKYGSSVDITNVIPKINECLNGFAPMSLLQHVCSVGRSRQGDKPVGGVTWCDKLELIKDHIKLANQIVGHTFVGNERPYTHWLEDNNDLTIKFIDCAEGQIDNPTFVCFDDLIK